MVKIIGLFDRKDSSLERQKMGFSCKTGRWQENRTYDKKSLLYAFASGGKK